MGTPAMLFGAIIRSIMVALTVFWGISFLIVRVVVFIEAWRDAQSTRQDESWLLSQCQSPAFFANMRQHTDICLQVQRNAERSPALAALNAVANTAHLCGRQSCLDALVNLVDNGGWPALVWAAVALVMGNMLICLMQRFIRVGRRRCAVYKSDCALGL